MSEQELMELPAERKKLETFFIEFNPAGLDEVTAKIRGMAEDLPADMAVKKNRDAVASFAYRIARLKTTVDKAGADLKAEYVEIPKKIDATRRQYKDALESLQHEVRKPVTDWEETEKQRVAELQARLAGLQAMAQAGDATAVEIRSTIAAVEDIAIGSDWQEFATEGRHLQARALETLRKALAAAEQREAEQAELERLRQEAAEREQKEREERIAREAAEKARQEQAEALAKAQAEKELAEQRRIAAEKQAELDREKAEQERIAAEQKAEQDRIEAQARAKQQAEAAAQAERDRIAAEQAKAEAEKAAREADREHQGKINSAAMQVIQQAGQLSDEQARAIIVAIIKGRVPAVQINY